MDEVVRMAGCGLAVAAAAAPVGLAGWLVARRFGQPLFPKPQPWRVPWTGFEVLLALAVVQLVVPGLVLQLATGFAPMPPANGSPEAPAVRAVWAGVWAFPAQLVILCVAARVAYPNWRPTTEARAVPARVAVGVLAWAGLTPVVLSLHALLGWLFREMGWGAEDHPLAKLGTLTDLEGGLFFAQAAVAAPVVEEVLYRGVLLAWLVGGRSVIDRPVHHRPTSDRGVWAVFAVGVLMAVLTGRGTAGPVLFAVGLPAGWAVVRTALRRKRRTVGAVVASAALFAGVHSAVWPSPVPLFLLGLGLGWLAVRTRGVIAPAVVHGLFNAVSVLFVLRGGAG